MTEPIRPTFDSKTFARSAEVLDIVLDHISQGMVVIGADYRTLAFNRRFEEMFRLPPGTVEVGRDFRDVLRVWARETGQDDAMLTRAIAELDLTEPFEFEFEQDIHGEMRWCLLTHNPIPGNGCVRTFTDITERKRLEALLRQQSLTDPLTGIWNRRAILEFLDVELERFHRHHGKLAVLSLDLDHFKKVNDGWGHLVGDAVLRRFTEVCRAQLRKSDRFGRAGGEEFLVVVPDGSLGDALQLGERLREAVAAMRIEPGEGRPALSVTVSIGVAAAHRKEGATDLIQRADRALYKAKANGRNRVEKG